MHTDAPTPPPPKHAAEWLAHLVDMLGAEAGGMLTIRPDGGHQLVYPGSQRARHRRVSRPRQPPRPAPTLLAERPDGRALVFDTTTHPAYVAQWELSACYLQPHDIDHVVATRWREPDDSQHYVGVQRFRGAAPFHPRQGAEFDALIRHWRVGNALPPSQGVELREIASRRRVTDCCPIPILIG
ncbi:hypothetical protein [Thauera sp.]|uniref:hypothetical protein n=1 Tax=Thauera sp. TaxID=1905334 RepID=UPI001B422BA8|nr:hypothetical protein [Thauera sp.]MBP6130274.1 hypothetical protein [Thauera sp.]